MNILAIESSTETVSVALLTGDALVEWEGTAEQVRRQGNLLGVADELCRGLEEGVKSLDCIAFGRGPGAFTGLRTACSLSLGLAEALALPVVTVCSLRAVALQVEAVRICVLLDARMSQLYWTLFERDSTGLRQIAPVLCSAPGDIVLPGAGWVLAGSGCVVAGDLVRSKNPGACDATLADCLPRAATLAKEAERECREGRGLDRAQVELSYVRDNVALTIRERLAQKASS
ncbi:tRNA (adenosine(37)-N6)-threonylcarbamoyltransferase complex dimerization subunit type 1 TsaB [Niveibacterium terrae]|uniref:tRNA (adenosine(37)-N6)-threonylcarbamoyltransferase complex dimerization subunit type 1 TsaB n=1 Tax=Niveibacterium terrae TaxID=3373598 RepID=UPI003A944083